MQSLPCELQLEIHRYLPDSALNALSKTCRHNYNVTTPLLYETLAITLRLESCTTSPSQKIKAYAANNWYRCKYLTSIAITCREPTVWSLKGHDMLVCLHILLTRCPQIGLKSFAWEVDCSLNPDILEHLPWNLEILNTNASLIVRPRPFDRMVEFTCRNLTEKKSELFVRQLLHVGPHLRKLCIDLEPSATVFPSSSLVEALRNIDDNMAPFNQLTHLELHNMFLQEWPFGNMSSIQTLSLQRCPNVDMALANFIIQRPAFANLRILKLFLCSDPKFLPKILKYFEEVAELEELQILMEGNTYFPLDRILPFSKTLNHLVLESRRTWAQPITVNPYPSEDFLSIIDLCTSLRTLGIPVLIDKALCVRKPQSMIDFFTDRITPGRETQPK